MIPATACTGLKPDSGAKSIPAARSACPTKHASSVTQRVWPSVAATCSAEWPTQSTVALIPATAAEWPAALANALGTPAPTRIATIRIPPCQTRVTFVLSNIFHLGCLDWPFTYMSVERSQNRQRLCEKLVWRLQPESERPNLRL